MGLQPQGMFPFPVKNAVVIGISTDGIEYDLPSLASTGRPDAYIYFKEKEWALFLEVKTGSYPLGRAQMSNHRTVAPTAEFKEAIVKSWREILGFVTLELELAEKGSKVEYVLNNFIDFAFVEALGIEADHERFLIRCGQHREAMSILHNQFKSYGYTPKFYDEEDPRTMEYYKNEVSHVAIDLKHNRLIYKFRRSRYKSEMEGFILQTFGRNYTGTHHQLSSEANVPLDLITVDNIAVVLDLFQRSLAIRNG